MTKTGRKSKYETHVKPFLSDISEWIHEYTEEPIAAKLGVSPSAYYEYKKQHKELRDAIFESREKEVQMVKNSLKRKALGFYYDETKTLKRADGSVDTEIYHKYAQPDVKAAHLWLKNHDPEWRNDDATLTAIKKEAKVMWGVPY